ncbi:hypothetical protein C8R48DRAFT_59023 [Suillus tomentosus]|nr:hypothetical protein C8R48DRAFT_59023 [Suillus tomentosus]
MFCIISRLVHDLSIVVVPTYRKTRHVVIGRTECTYEPAMTKAFLRGRTEAIRTVQLESIDFTKTFSSECLPDDQIRKLHKACERHIRLTKECSQGLGQDRRLYALYCLHQRQVTGNLDPSPDDPIPNRSIQKRMSSHQSSLTQAGIYSAPLSCPLQTAGIVYTIKENGISVYAFIFI